MIGSLKDKNLRNHIWHADGGFRPDAPAFTALFAQQLPDFGGDTITAMKLHYFSSAKFSSPVTLQSHAHPNDGAREVHGRVRFGRRDDPAAHSRLL